MRSDLLGIFRLDKYIHDYLVKKGLHMTADVLAGEADVVNPSNVAIKTPEGFLTEWWDGFCDILNSNQAEHAQESYNSYAATLGMKCFACNVYSSEAMSPVFASPLPLLILRLDKYIHDYFVKKGMHETAEAFASEADIVNPTDVAVQSPEGFLADWWDGFYDMFSSNQAKHAQESYVEAARTIENVAHNISPVVPAFSPERSQEQFHPRTPEDEVTSHLRFLEMDCPSQRVPFVTDSSRPMEQIPNMPQQWEARDAGEGCGIYFDQTMQMEPNSDALKKAMLPVPDLSETDSSIGSCSGMQQTP